MRADPLLTIPLLPRFLFCKVTFVGAWGDDQIPGVTDESISMAALVGIFGGAACLLLTAVVLSCSWSCLCGRRQRRRKGKSEVEEVSVVSATSGDEVLVISSGAAREWRPFE